MTGGLVPELAVHKAANRVQRAMLAHQPAVNWQYEELNCSCGWLEDDALGVHTIKDGTRTWPEHQRKAVRAVG